MFSGMLRASRLMRFSSDDADRLRNFLARFALDWSAVQAAGGTHPRPPFLMDGCRG
jgi:sigma54-dependent transcription regulator